MNVPFVDLKLQYETIKTEIDNGIQSVIENNAYVGGKFVKEFEANFAKSCGAKHCIGVGNGTDAIFIALKCLGIGYGDEVITAANSFIATSEAISRTGAQVKFCDIDRETYTINPDIIEAKVTEKTKAILVVHLYGQPADMDKIKQIAKKHNLFIVEDAAQAHIAEYKGHSVGVLGDVACFSFYPGKNLGAYGDGGAIVTDDDLLAEKMRMFANHGRMKKYNHEFEGTNSRLDGLQACILNVKLKHLPIWTEKRRKVALLYGQLLGQDENVTIPTEKEYAKHVYHLYVVRVKERGKLQEFLKSKGISTGIHYPIGLPFLQAYKHLGHKPDDFPVTAQYQDMILSLPVFAELDHDKVACVCSNIIEFIRS